VQGSFLYVILSAVAEIAVIVVRQNAANSRVCGIQQVKEKRQSNDNEVEHEVFFPCYYSMLV